MSGNAILRLVNKPIILVKINAPAAKIKKGRLALLAISLLKIIVFSKRIIGKAFKRIFSQTVYIL